MLNLNTLPDAPPSVAEETVGRVNNKTCPLSVRIHPDDMKFLKRRATDNCRTIAEEVRYIIKQLRFGNKKSSS